jgi:hypothetical protein
MAPATPRPEAAWTALWNGSSVYDLAGAIRHGRRVGHVWLRRLKSVSFRPTGPIVLLNQEPWGCVDIDFGENHVSQLHTITGSDCRIDEKAGTISATIQFSQLKYHSTATLRRSEASGSALKVASLFMRAPESLGATDDDNIVLAKNYQSQLANSASGRTMLSTYYQYNDNYADCFQNSPKFVHYWQTLPTNGKTTSYFANQTSTAAANPNGPAVNADPDYGPHAVAMQTILVATCNTLNFNDAANAATEFKNVAQGPSQQPQTVNAVMNIVSTTPPPTGLNDVMRLTAAEPESHKQAKMRPDVQQAILEIEQEQDDIRHGIVPLERTQRPIHTGYRAYLEPVALTISGTLGTGGPKGGLSVTFTKVTGTPSAVEGELGVFPGNLHAEVKAALDRATFVKALLGQRVLSALNDKGFLAYVSRMMTLAMNESLGPVNA